MDGQEQGTSQWCSVCAENGQQSLLQLFQINQTEAVFLCPEPECTYPLGTKDLALVPRNASEVLSQRRKKNKKRGVSNIAKKDTVFLKTRNSNTNQSVQLGKISSRNQQNNQHNQLLKKPQPDIRGSLFGSQPNLAVKKSAFTPYTRDPVGTGQSKTSHSNDGSPVASSSIQPTVGITALPSFLEPEKPSVNVPKPISHEDEDIEELLNNLPDFENPHELDSKLSDLFSDLEAKPLGSTDVQSDSGIFDISNDPNCLDFSFIEAGVEELGVNQTPVQQITSGSQNQFTSHVLTSEPAPQSVIQPKPQKDALAPVKVVAERNTAQYLQWKNVDALCWLDVCLCLLVHSAGIAHILHSISLPQACILTTILQAYKKAQDLLHKANSLQTLSIEEVGKALKLETSIGRVSVKTGGGEIGDLFCASPVRLLPSGELATSPHTPTPTLRPQNIEQEEVFRCLQSASSILRDVRENVWAYLYPKLKCERGKNDSPVFALPLLLSNHSEIEAKLMVKYEWRMICDVCGYLHKDKVQKVLPTFPQVPPDFTMLAPCFKRACFQCQAPNQTMDMILENGLPDVLTVHFVEGLWRVNLADYDFSHRGSHYAVSGVVQYTENPSHFVTWIRNVESDSWMECNDLKSPVCQYINVTPSFPPSQVHLVVWERQDASRQTRPSDRPIFSPTRPVQHQTLGDKTLENFAIPQTFQTVQSNLTSEHNCDLLMETKPLTMTKFSTASTLYATPGSNVASVAHTVTPVTTSTWSTSARPQMQSKVVNSRPSLSTSSVHLVPKTAPSTVKSTHVSGPSQARSTPSNVVSAPALTTSSVVGKSKDQFSLKQEMGRTLQIARPLPMAVPTRRIGNLLGVQSGSSSAESSEDRLARMRERFQKQKLGQVANFPPIPVTPEPSKTTKSKKSTTPLASRKTAELLLKKPAKVGILKQSGEELRDYVRSRYNFQEAGKQVFAGYKSSKSGSGSNSEKLADVASQLSQPASRKRKGDALATKPKSKAARMGNVIAPTETTWSGRSTEQAHPKAQSYPQVPGILPLLPKSSLAKCTARQTETVDQMPLPIVQSQSQASSQPPPVSRVVAETADYTIQSSDGNPTQDASKDEVPVLRLELSTGSGKKTITLKRSGANKEGVSEESLQSILRQICSSLSGQESGSSVFES